MEYRRANRSDLDLFLKNRIEFVTLIRKISNIEDFENKTQEYLKEHIEKDDLIIFIAVDKNTIVSSCMACIYQTVPKPSCPNGTSAELLNVYTLKEYRRNGHAEKLIRMLIQEVKNYGVEKMVLDYTDMGQPLYEKLGFMPLQNQMQLRL
jgi:ribosomal protein S18 acetylase RimI-like enzyme